MNYSYTQWKKHLMDEDVHAMAILSFPAVTQCATTVQELVQNAEMQSAVMRRIKEEFPLQEALVSMMDLSVEAQAFGCPVSFHEGEIPAVTSGIIKNREDGEALRIPKMEEGRMSVYLAGVENITKESDRPVFGGVCGPYSLAGRLMDVSEIMMQCIMDPKLVHLVLQKVTTFLKQYIQAYKDVGASGVILAEPLAGLLSPAMVQEFSSSYIREITEELQDDTFTVIYHNCGPNTVQSLPEILSSDCGAWHFGNAVSLKKILEQVPADCLIMGNLDPVGCFCGCSADELEHKERALLKECGAYSNFVLSTGCDLPPKAKWENIQRFFRTLEQVNSDRRLPYSMSSQEISKGGNAAADKRRNDISAKGEWYTARRCGMWKLASY